MSLLTVLPQNISQLCQVYLNQGSVLGPLLFCNDLMNLDLSEGSSLVLYADDILLYRLVTCVADFAALQSDVNMIQTWTSSNFMSFNESKCKVMHVSRKDLHYLLLYPYCSMVQSLRRSLHSSTWDFSYRCTCHGQSIIKTPAAKPGNFLGFFTEDTIYVQTKPPCSNCTPH